MDVTPLSRLKRVFGLGRNTKFLFLIGFFLFFLTSIRNFARTTAQEQVLSQKPLKHEVSVALKLIHVYVSDRNGRPVRGLQREDFVLRDDGIVREVTDFEEHVPAESAVPVEVVTTPLRAPRLPGRKLLFFFDYGFNTGNGIQRSARIALDFLDKRLGPRDQVAVAVFSGLKGLQVPLLFTSDIKAARDLINRIGAFEQSGRILEIEDTYQQNLKDGAFADARPESTLSWNVPTATGFNPEAEQRHLILRYLDNLLALARALHYEPGQKQMIFFSDGPPYRSIWGGDRLPFAEVRNLAEELLKELASANVTVFALNTAEPDARPELVRGGSLQKMAQATGGRYWGNSYVAEAFTDQVQSQTGSYYVLGYPVDERWDGRYHRIKVEAMRPGMSIRTMAGYFNPKLFADCSEEERRIQLVDLALAETPLRQTPVRFAMAAVPIGTAIRSGLRMAASVPVQEIREAIGRRTEIEALVFDFQDEIAAERRRVVEEKILTEGSATVVSDVIVPPGEYRCRIIVRNLETGRAAVAGMTVRVPGPLEAGVRILPPLLLRPERAPRWDLEAPAGKTKAKTPPAEDGHGPLFNPAQYGPLLGTVLRAGTEIGAEVHVITAGKAVAKIRLEAFLLDQLNQERIPVAVTVVARRDEPGGSALFIRIPVPDLEPDIYTIVIVAEDESNGGKAEIQRDVSIEKVAGTETGRGGEG